MSSSHKRAVIYRDRSGKYRWKISRSGRRVAASTQGYVRHISAVRNLRAMHPDAIVVSDTPRGRAAAA